MKRISIRIATCLMLFISACIASMAQTVTTVNGIRFLIENNEAIVGRQDKDLSGDIVIPSEIEHEGKTYPVTRFVNPTNLTAWSSNTVTVEGGAFQSCQITSVVIPSSVCSIAAGAFSDCHKLQSVVFPNNLKEIGAACFANCISIEELNIPETVKAFGSNSNYGFVSYTFGGCTKLKAINIPSNVTALYEGCFKGSGIDSIYIPKTIAILRDDCFATSSLKVVKMGVSDLSKLSYSRLCFGANNMYNTDLLVPKGSLAVYQEYEPWSNFKSLQEYGEEGEIFIPDQINISFEGLRYILKNNEAIVSRQSSSLSGNIVIPEKVTYKNIEYPVTSMVVPTDLVCYSSNTISCTGGAFQGSCIESITIPSSITTISAGAFQNCRNLTKVILPSTIKVLSAACFAGCINLEDINIPESITDLASRTEYGYVSYVFGGCKKIKNFEVPSKVKTLASGCFLGSGIEIISIPSGCSSLDEDCLNTQNLKEVTMYVRDLEKLSYTESSFGTVSNATLKVPLGCKQTYQEYYPWMDFASIEEFDDGKGEFTPTNITTRIDGIRYILSENFATVARQNKDLSGDIVIPSTVMYGEKEYIVNKMIEPTNIIAWSSNTVSTENGAFQSCPITSIEIPATITIIPAGAFYNCRYLENVSMSEGVTQLGAASFTNCIKLEELQIPESVKNLGSYTRYGFKSYVFGNCSSLKKVNIPSGVTKLAEGCFKGSGLETFIIPSNVTRLDEDCFSMGKLKGVKITHTNLNVLTYTESVFSNVSNVSLYVPEGTADLYKEFYPWKNFKEIIEYKDQNDEFNFNAYSVSYVIPSMVSNAKSRLRILSQNKEEEFAKDYVTSGIKPEEIDNPLLDGYEFIGWENLPNIMPANDVVVFGTFKKKRFLVTFKIGDEVIAADSLEYGAAIIAPEAPEKEGHTFNGWDEVAEIVPACDLTYEGSYSVNSYLLAYIVDGDTIQTDSVAYGTEIIVTDEPTKEGYTFSGWSEVPEAMPASDVTISGTFTINKYLVTFKIDDEVISVDSLEYGAIIVIPEAPEKEGHTFNGWDEVLETVPANDVTIEGSYSVNSYLLTYMVDGEIVKADSIAYGTVITFLDEPTKEGYTFSGWSEAPETMPASNVTVSGIFTINQYTITYIIDGEVFATDTINYGEAITVPEVPVKESYDFAWIDEIPETMPAKDIVINGSYTSTDIVNIERNEEILYIYSTDGQRVNELQKGINIVLQKDGSIRKVFQK